jgi:hypothetical protein
MLFWRVAKGQARPLVYILRHVVCLKKCVWNVNSISLTRLRGVVFTQKDKFTFTLTLFTKGCTTVTNLLHAAEFLRSYYSALRNDAYILEGTLPL